MTDERGYDNELLFRDKFITGWVTVWFIPSLVVYCLFIKSAGGCKSSTLPLIVNTLFLLRSILEIISWFTWCITQEYDENSITFIVDVIILASHTLSVFVLYMFFIIRLHRLYEQSNMGIQNWYVLLIIICLINLCCGISLTISYYVFATTFYVILNITCLSLEVIMYCILCWLFSKPLITLSVNQRKDDNNFLTKSNTFRTKDKTNDNLLRILTKLNILNTISLVTSITLRGFDIASFLHCPDECGLTYFTYSLWSLDVFINIFCVLCSYAHGDYWYGKCCNRLHEFVLFKCIGKIMDKKIEAIQKYQNANAKQTNQQL